MPRLRIATRSFTDFESALAAQIAAFRKQHPEMEVEAVSFELQGLEAAVLGSEGLRGGDWDLAIFPTDWIGAAERSGALANLDPWMEASPLPGWPDGWPSSLREPLRQREGFFCIPWHDGPECLIYRRDLFEDAGERRAFAARFGRPLAPPRTWQEFHEIARFFTRPAGDLYGTLFAAAPDGHNTLYDIVLQVWSRGGELYAADGAPTLSSATAVEALDYYRHLVNDAKACYPGSSTVDSIQSGDLFLSGRIAMMVNWFGFAARCSRPDSALQGKIGLAAIPGGKPGETATLSNYWVIGIGSGGKSKQESYELLRHIASPEMDKLTALNGAVGVRLSTWNDADVLGRVPLYAQLEKLSAEARTLPFCEDLPKLAQIVNQVTVEALTTGEASRSILERAQAAATASGVRLVQEIIPRLLDVEREFR